MPQNIISVIPTKTLIARFHFSKFVQIFSNFFIKNRSEPLEDSSVDIFTIFLERVVLLVFRGTDIRSCDC